MKTIKTALAATVLLTIVGCQSAPEQPREVATNDKQEKTDNSYELYQNAKTQYETWLVTLKEAEDLKLYSVDKYRELLKAWDEAVEIYEEIAVDPSKTTKSYSLFSSGTYVENFDKRMVVVDTNYNELLGLKETADDVLADSIAQMTYLDDIDAVKVYPQSFQSVKIAYKKLYKYVEEGDIDDAQTGQVSFLEKAKQLEMKVMIKRYVSPLKKELKDLRQDDFDEIAAISYAKAKAEIDSTEQTIRSNPRDLEVIEEAVADAEFELDHVRSVAQEVKRLENVDDDEFEPIVLEYESKLLAISQELNNADYRNLSLNSQAESILDSVTETMYAKEEATSDRSETLLKQKEEISKLKMELALKAEAQAKTEEEKSTLEKQVSQLEVQIASQQTLLSAYQAQLEGKAGAADKAVADKAQESEVNTASEEVAPEAAAAE